jgi:hypothetical protein
MPYPVPFGYQITRMRRGVSQDTWHKRSSSREMLSDTYLEMQLHRYIRNALPDEVIARARETYETIKQEDSFD